MALDAVIKRVETTSEGCVLFLEPRDSKVGPAGQSQMTIISPTITPVSGQIIWGNSYTVYIVDDKNSKEYRRIGYSKLKEHF